MPSDFAGVGYTDVDKRGAWKGELLRELVAAGGYVRIPGIVIQSFQAMVITVSMGS